jgi:hypothetical protein
MVAGMEGGAMKLADLSPNAATVLDGLYACAEGEPEGGFRMVYLDNARPAGMSAQAFAGHLSALEARGLYKPVDGYAWGMVRAER